MDTITKVCRRCNQELDVREFYKRPYENSYTSECKSCMKARSAAKHVTNEDYQVPVVESEKMAIAYLEAQGIPALPGKTIRHSFVDVIAYGCIGVEVKYSGLEESRGVEMFIFSTTPSQQKKGFRAKVVMIICDYGNELTYHFFDATDPVFYMGERLKTGFTFRPGAMEALKHSHNRVVMTQPLMDEARDKVKLVEDHFRGHCEELKRKHQP